MSEQRRQRRKQERAQKKTGVQITTESGVPRRANVSVTAEVITPDYKIRRFPCNGEQYNRINDGEIPEGLPQDIADSIAFTARLHEQGAATFMLARDRAYANTFGDDIP